MSTEDPRALLRAQRLSRRITHPHASYTAEGKLLCNLCDTFVKSEAQWQGHLHSEKHISTSRSAKEENGVAAKPGLKRKAETLDEKAEETVDGGKRLRFADHEEINNGAHKPVDVQDDSEEGEETVIVHDLASSPLASSKQNGERPPTSQIADGVESATNTASKELEIPDSEFLAFEQDLADLENAQNQAANSVLTAAATISALPVMASDLPEDDTSQQRGRRDAELEADKEDAEAFLAEEMEEMQGLEERVRKLRERREQLRHQTSNGLEAGGIVDEPAAEIVVDGSADVDDDEEDDEDDEDDGWTFGGPGVG